MHRRGRNRNAPAAQEDYETALTAKLNRFHATIVRMDAVEVEHAKEVEKQLARGCTDHASCGKEQYFKAAVEKKHDGLTAWFAGLGKKQFTGSLSLCFNLSDPLFRQVCQSF